MKKRGISIITLVVTIIIMIVLATVVFLTLNNGNVISKAGEAQFKQNAKQYQEELNVYASSYILENQSRNLTLDDINASAESEPLSIKEVISSINGNSYDIQKFLVIKGELYFAPQAGNEQDEKKADWCRQIDIKVLGDSTEQYVSTSKYIETFIDNEVTWLCSPEIGGFDKSRTYYLTYGLNGEEILTPLTSSVPEDWYSYSSSTVTSKKRWANLVVEDALSGDAIYLVWIPRYMYKINSDNNTIDVKFVDTNNVYKTRSVTEGTLQQIKASEVVTTTEADLESSGYLIPEAFNLDTTDDETIEGDTTKLAGFWVSKYEIQESIGISGFSADVRTTNIEVTGITLDYSNGSIPGLTYEFYQDGVLKNTSNTARYNFENLTEQTPYVIKVAIKDSNGRFFGEYSRTLTTVGTPIYNQASEPDISGFNKLKTYYLTYDGSGNEIRTIMQGNSAPEGWYDYSTTNKRWANIIVEDTVTGDAVYLVWIPRYEYRVCNNETNSPYIDIAFIEKNKIIPTEGYQIPESFMIDMSDEEVGGIKQISGFWVSKYEMQEIDSITNFTLDIKGTEIGITGITLGFANGTIPTPTYEYYIDGTLDGTSTAKTHTFDNLSGSTQYTIKIVLKDGNGRIYGEKSRTVTTLAVPDYGPAEEPDISGFDKSKTYYLTYNGSTEVRTLMQGNSAPEGWYDYSTTNKRWANIIVEDTTTGDAVYLVWIPRYEYRVANAETNSPYMDISFIPKTKVIPTEGYLIPEAFMLDMSDEEGGETVQLAGFWISKYEMQEVDSITSFTLDVKGTEIGVTGITLGFANGTIPTPTYEYYINGTLDGTSTAKTYTFDNLSGSTQYTIKIVLKDGQGRLYGEKTRTVTTLAVPDYGPAEAPDISGFNKSRTYYLTYDGSGNEIRTLMQGNSAPSGWYDYSTTNKRWANVVVENTSTGEAIYLVWIPRYEYRVGNAETSSPYMDISFIPKTKVIPTEGYLIPEAFSLDMSDDGGITKELAGFWVSKYEMQEVEPITNFMLDVRDTKISVNDIILGYANGVISTPTYEYYLNGTLINTSTTKAYTYTGLIQNTEYTIKIILKDGNGRLYGEKTRTVRTTNTPTYSEAAAPDISGFNKSRTYYLTYNGSAEVRTLMQGNSAPSGWYDYSTTNKRWANIVVVDPVAGTEVYLVWIPRYEYRICNNETSSPYIDIAFIPATKIVPTNGYQIPEAFTIDMSDDLRNNVNLSGYWVSKYEMNDQ